jgi:nitronate monooxygenase
MRNFECWTCGHYTYRLKDTTNLLPDGNYQILTAEHIFKDYQFSKDNKVALPPVAPTA